MIPNWTKLDFRTHLIFLHPQFGRYAFGAPFNMDSKSFFAFLQPFLAAPTGQTIELQGFFFLQALPRWPSFWNLEAPSIFMLSGINVTVPDFCITSDEQEGGAPLEGSGGHCSSRSAPTLLTDLNVPLSLRLSSSCTAHTHTHTLKWLPGSNAQHLFGCHMTFRVFLLSSPALRHFLPSLSLSSARTPCHRRGSSSRKKQKAQQLQPPLVG